MFRAGGCDRALGERRQRDREVLKDLPMSEAAGRLRRQRSAEGQIPLRGRVIGYHRQPLTPDQLAFETTGSYRGKQNQVQLEQVTYFVAQA